MSSIKFHFSHILTIVFTFFQENHDPASDFQKLKNSQTSEINRTTI